MSLPALYETVTIPAGATGGPSDAQDLGSYRLAGLITPVGWVTAVVSFQVSADGTNFVDAYTDDGTTNAQLQTQSLVASHAVLFTGALALALAAAKAVKIRSGLTGAGTNQTGAPVVGLMLVPRG